MNGGFICRWNVKKVRKFRIVLMFCWINCVVNCRVSLSVIRKSVKV